MYTFNTIIITNRKAFISLQKSYKKYTLSFMFFLSLALFHSFILILHGLIREMYFKFHSKFDGDT